MAIKAWLFRICINQIRNKHRRHAVPTADLPDELPEHGRPDPVATTFDDRESDQEMRALLLRLPSTYRPAVVLKFVNDLSYSEIAEALGQPEGTVKSNVHRGLKLLRSYLESEKKPGFSSIPPSDLPVLTGETA